MCMCRRGLYRDCCIWEYVQLMEHVGCSCMCARMTWLRFGEKPGRCGVESRCCTCPAAYVRVCIACRLLR